MLAPGRNTQLLLVMFNDGVEIWDCAESEVGCCALNTSVTYSMFTYVMSAYNLQIAFSMAEMLCKAQVSLGHAQEITFLEGAKTILFIIAVFQQLKT